MHMKSQATILLALIAALAVANAEDSQSPSPGTGTSETEEPALPTSESGPSNSEPGLLPESGELPARPPAGLPGKLSPAQASSRQVLEKDDRFEQIRSLAMSDSRAAHLLRRAKHSSNSASRRTYLRAYYVNVASRMRKLDPKLKSSIDAYEEAKIREVYGGRASAVRAFAHGSKLHRSASQEAHHRSHRVSARTRYRRIIIIDDGYAPGFPPYGPPVVFYPW